MTQMNRQQLLTIFRYLSAPEYRYDLGTNRLHDCCFDVEHTEQGWETYFTERGGKFHTKIHDNETDACLDLLHRVMHLKGSHLIQPMNRRQTLSILNYLQAPQTLYRRHWYAYSDYYLDMKQTAQGWEVFTCERGVKRDVVVFENETDACLDLLYKVMHL